MNFHLRIKNQCYGNMAKTKITVDISFFKTAFWLTVILGILKIAKVINISNWLVFLPLLAAVGLAVIIIFLIGLMVLFYIATHKDELEKELESSDDENEEVTD